ncbi:hypothetical protein [Sphingomonas sp. BAUL-RG-20F-R05-02]|uniref:hypothetical protein n=1 Tax=Sphingomonas sp. BAUL-RG-20F-R05-02 TaxID=2914830 RepID=UPI001F56EF76|nr:hypothetical protein [Sphingomonas sp. BAUL-RG-20F-R05-02]
MRYRAARGGAKFKLAGNLLSGAQRPAHLLAELVTCGVCGALSGRTAMAVALQRSPHWNMRQRFDQHHPTPRRWRAFAVGW